MTETKRFHCGECGYYWEITTKKKTSKSCPICSSINIYRVSGNRRYSRKSRTKVRRTTSSYLRR